MAVTARTLVGGGVQVGAQQLAERAPWQFLDEDHAAWRTVRGELFADGVHLQAHRLDMLDALGNPPQETDLSINLLWNHLDMVPTDGRRFELRDHPFYGQFVDGVD